jgi:hypothetical protein
MDRGENRFTPITIAQNHRIAEQRRKSHQSVRNIVTEHNGKLDYDEYDKIHSDAAFDQLSLNLLTSSGVGSIDRAILANIEPASKFSINTK